MALVISVTVGLAACGAGAELAGPPPRPQANPPLKRGLPAGGQSSNPADFEECPFASVRPTYLPWLEPGEEVPRPSKDQSWGYGSLNWFASGSRPGWEAVTQDGLLLEPYLALRAYTSTGGSGSGEPVATRLNGIRGYLYGAEVAGAAAIIWEQATTARCKTIALGLETFGRLSQGETQRELRRIAESLEP